MKPVFKRLLSLSSVFDLLHNYKTMIFIFLKTTRLSDKKSDIKLNYDE